MYAGVWEGGAPSPGLTQSSLWLIHTKGVWEGGAPSPGLT